MTLKLFEKTENHIKSVQLYYLAYEKYVLI